MVYPPFFFLTQFYLGFGSQTKGFPKSFCVGPFPIVGLVFWIFPGVPPSFFFFPKNFGATVGPPKGFPFFGNGFSSNFRDGGFFSKFSPSFSLKGEEGCLFSFSLGELGRLFSFPPKFGGPNFFFGPLFFFGFAAQDLEGPFFKGPPCVFGLFCAKKGLFPPLPSFYSCGNFWVFNFWSFFRQHRGFFLHITFLSSIVSQPLFFALTLWFRVCFHWELLLHASLSVKCSFCLFSTSLR